MKTMLILALSVLSFSAQAENLDCSREIRCSKKGDAVLCSDGVNQNACAISSDPEHEGFQYGCQCAMTCDDSARDPSGVECVDRANR